MAAKEIRLNPYSDSLIHTPNQMSISKETILQK